LSKNKYNLLKKIYINIIMSKFKCQNSDVVKIAEKLLDMAKQSDITNFIPISKNDISNVKKSLEQYNRDCVVCTNQGNSYRCHQAAETKLMRSMPFLNKNIYPWNNYDWDYGNFIDNNYSVLATGATKGGSISDLFKNMRAFMKLVKGYISDPNPADSSYPGKMARDGDVPYFECTGNTVDSEGNRVSDPSSITTCRAINKIKYSNPEKPPTKDDFLKKYKITGDKSSSYYVKVGSCPRPDLKTVDQCESKGYSWIPNIIDNIMDKMPFLSKKTHKPGSCHQPRYAYINNSPGFKIGGVKFRGLVPSLANDFLALSPDKIVAAMEGKSIDNLFELQQCPQVVESFQQHTNTIYNDLLGYNTIVLLILLFLVFYIRFF
jgi:hypothetical protein